MTPQQNKYYKMLKEQLMVRAAGETISAVNAGVAVNKLLQISCGAAYTDDKEVVEFDAAPRLSVLEEVLEETDRKVIIFALFRSSIDTIVTYLTKKGYGVEQIHGDVNATKRGRIINDFQTTDAIQVLVMQPAATAHGITLTAADTVVFYGPLMSVEQYMQAIARADRKGQDSDKVTVVHIESSPIEKKLFKAMNTKVNDSVLLTDLFKSEVKTE
jgi:SNF2 family DNA or RNA helicase